MGSEMCIRDRDALIRAASYSQESTRSACGWSGSVNLATARVGHRCGTYSSVGGGGTYSSVGGCGTYSSVGRCGTYSSVGKCGTYSSVVRCGTYSSVVGVGHIAQWVEDGTYSSVGRGVGHTAQWVEVWDI